MDTFDDLDEPTQPFTHAQIGQMLNAAQAGAMPSSFRVDLESFLRFGENGTPPGMIGSSELPLASGWCGDPPPAESAGATCEPDGYPWGPAPLELTQTEPRSPTPGSAEQLTRAVDPPPAPPAELAGPTELELDAAALFREAPGDGGEALENDLVGAGLRGRGWVFALGLALLGTGLGVIAWLRVQAEAESEPVVTAPAPVHIPPVEVPPDPDRFDNAPDEHEDRLEPVSETGVEERQSEDQDKRRDEPEDDSANTPRFKTARCSNVRAQAKAADHQGQWSELERLGRDTKCWKNGHEAKALRMKALFELGRLDECLRVGKRGNHREIKRWNMLCSHGRR